MGAEGLIDDDPDADLIVRIGRGDAVATRMLVAAKLPRILGLATRVLRDANAADDIAQEAFVRVWRAAPRWQPGKARFDTWLHTVVLNLCRDRLRRRRSAGVDPHAQMPDVADPAPDAEARLIAAQQARQVADAIAALPERQREAIVLVHYQDMSGAEAAEVMNISVDALESVLARGRRTLRAQLAPSQEGDAHD